MKKKLLFILALLCAVVQGAWAQNGIYCTASDVGRVVCTDGSIYDNVSAATAVGSHAVAKIIWVDEKNKKGLALNLWDEGYANRTDAIERCNNKNTSVPVAGAAWKLATKDEWDTMINAAGGQQNLANGFSSVGGNNLNTSYGYYATSSVTSYAPNRKYYVYKFGSYSGWTDSKNDLACLIRPCLTFNLLTLYTINNQNDWFNFCDKVNGGDTFSDKYVKITCDDHWLPIMSEMAGTDETHSFQGVFDGNGHTITFNVTVTATEDYCAPFRHVKNAVIKNLRVNGYLYVNAKFTAGIVAESHGNLVIDNCRSSVGIFSSKSGDGTHAGFVALLNGADNAITINNCVFDGQFRTTNGTTNCAGFIGWPVQNKPTIKNSIMMPEKVDAGMVEKTFARFPNGYEPTITDCYFVNTVNLPTNQGTQAGYATLPENEICKPITTTNPVVKTLYSVASTVSGVKDSYELDGAPANIRPSVTDANGKTLALGTDFTATLNSTTVTELPVTITTLGHNTLILTGMGDYVGSKSCDIYLRPGNNSNIELADGETYTITEDCATASVTYKKTLGEERVGKYQAWFVPFDYTITDNDLLKFDFYKINIIANAPNPQTNATDDIWVFLKKMSANEVLRANMPYVYKPKQAVEDYKFTAANATLKAKAADARITMMTAEDTYTVFGTYANTTATAQDPFYYVNIDGDLSLGNDGSVTVGAFRWIMRVESKFGETPAYARGIHFFDGEGEATGIASMDYGKLKMENEAGAWYTLDGRRLDGKPAKKGVYVNKGIKVVIK